MNACHFRSLAVLATLLVATAAQAQYAWTDQQGRKQYSDMPPPMSVPESRIFKQPGSAPAPTSSPTSSPDSVPAAGKAKESEALPPPTLAEKDAEFRKRRAEQAEKEKKAEEEARVSAENKKRCERLRDYRRSLEDGERIVRRDSKGERQFLSDEDRKRELADAKRTLADCK